MTDSSYEKVLEDLKNFITETKLLLEKVTKMRIECKESQMNMLRLFNPKCIKILEISSEASSKNMNQFNKNNKTAQMNIKRSYKAQCEKKMIHK
ncbi:PREDICTED: uncharacterized protein LOC105359140 [Ceratosolen solmsi marchali]|uniref:Uncharacterized protein LOC105359140 n=1 Tax=Ceratosolen solmsi marchali TaxID=326594 RepID=A0AAJ6YBI5_9HYME|nr:PREDICTED: uncharacterized protein LOC105359140 [Ceratosolen solmsi marchali]